MGDGVFEVLSTSGDTHLGGDDFDQRIVNWLATDFEKSEGIDLRKDRQALQRLTEAAEKAKIELSGTPQTQISLPFITATADGPKHIDTTLTRSKFEQLSADLLDRCRVPVEQVCVSTCMRLHTMPVRWGFCNNARGMCNAGLRFCAFKVLGLLSWPEGRRWRATWLLLGWALLLHDEAMRYGSHACTPGSVICNCCLWWPECDDDCRRYAMPSWTWQTSRR